MNLEYIKLCWRGHLRVLVGVPAFLFLYAAVFGALGGAKVMAGLLCCLAGTAPVIFAPTYGMTIGSSLLNSPWLEGDEPLPLSLRTRALSALAAAYAAMIAGSLALMLPALLLAAATLSGHGALMAAAFTAAAAVVASLYLFCLCALGGVILFYAFSFSLRQGRGVNLESFGFLFGMVGPLSVAAVLRAGYPGRAPFLWPAAGLLGAALALPAARLPFAIRLAWRQPGRWWIRGEAAASLAAATVLVYGCLSFAGSWKRRVEAWPALWPPYEGRVTEKDGMVEMDKRPLPGGTIVGSGDGALLWLRTDGRTTPLRGSRPAARFDALSLFQSATRDPRAVFQAAGALWLLDTVGLGETEIWTGPIGGPLRRVREAQREPKVKAVFENAKGGVELLALARSGRWFRSLFSDDEDPLSWTETKLSLPEPEAPGDLLQQRLIVGGQARWTDRGSSMTLDVADASGKTAHLMLTSAQLGTIGGGKPQPSVLRFDGRYVWLVLAGRTLAKAEAASDGAMLVAQWDLPDAQLLLDRNRRLYRPGEEGLFVSTRRGIELLDWEGRQRLLLAGRP